MNVFFRNLLQEDKQTSWVILQIHIYSIFFFDNATPLYVVDILQ